MIKTFLQKTAIIIAFILCVSMPLACAQSDDSQSKDILKKLVIGVDYYEPFVYLSPNGEFSGLDIEIATEVCRHIGYEPQFVYIDWGSKRSYLENGEIDCLWTCFTSTGRADKYAWTLPYLKSSQVVAVRRGSSIKKISDLKGKIVAVQSSTKADDIFSGKSSACKIEIPELRQLVCYSHMDYIFAALSSGNVDAVAAHQIVLESYAQSASFNIEFLEEHLLDVEVAVAFLQGTHSNVIKSINDAFILLKNNGFFAQLFSDYGLNPDLNMVDYE